jgi:endonuclease YncB( thermonuclease family)
MTAVLDKVFIACAVTVLLIIGATACADSKPHAIETTAHVVDGDTIELDDGTRVRLIGIDTPERGECGYVEATRHLDELIDGKTLTLTPGAQQDSDRYGRLLRYVDVGDDDAGLDQISSGFASARYDSTDGYGAHPREDLYHRVEDATGLPVCIPGTAPSNQPGIVSGGYPFCDAARADGAAPLHDGDPGWNPDLDRDGDGEACE